MVFSNVASLQNRIPINASNSELHEWCIVASSQKKSPNALHLAWYVHIFQDFSSVLI